MSPIGQVVPALNLSKLRPILMPSQIFKRVLTEKRLESEITSADVGTGINIQSLPYLP